VRVQHFPLRVLALRAEEVSKQSANAPQVAYETLTSRGLLGVVGVFKDFGGVGGVSRYCESLGVCRGMFTSRSCINFSRALSDDRELSLACFRVAWCNAGFDRNSIDFGLLLEIGFSREAASYDFSSDFVDDRLPVDWGRRFVPELSGLLVSPAIVVFGRSAVSIGK